MKFASADPVTVPASFEFVELVVKRSVFVPVSNCGFASIFGFGTLKQHVNWPIVSDINLTSVTVASAPLVSPMSFIPFITWSWNSPWTTEARLNVSTFKSVEDVEYTVDMPAAMLYGFAVRTFVGSL